MCSDCDDMDLLIALARRVAARYPDDRDVADLADQVERVATERQDANAEASWEDRWS